MKRLLLLLMLGLTAAPLAGCVVYPAHPVAAYHGGWVPGHYNAAGQYIPGHYS